MHFQLFNIFASSQDPGTCLSRRGSHKKLLKFSSFPKFININFTIKYQHCSKQDKLSSVFKHRILDIKNFAEYARN